MVHRIGLLVSFILLASCDGKPPLVDATEVVRVVPSTLEFALVAVGQDRTLTTSIQNEGRASVSLEVIDTPPGFLVAPRFGEVPPGASLPIQVTFQPGAIGRAEGVIRFASAKTGAAAVLSVAGTGIERVFEAPENLDFGTVVIGKVASRPVQIINFTDAPLRVRLRIDTAEFEVDNGEIGVDPLGTAAVEVSFTPQARGLLMGSLKIRPCPECSEVETILSGTGIENRLEVLPESVDFGSVAPGLVARRQVSVRNVGDGPIALSSPRMVPEVGAAFRVGLVEVEATLPVGGTGTLELVFAPEAMGPARARVVLSDVDGIQLGEVSLEGDGGGPLLTIAPEVIDFGTQPQGRPVTRNLRIENVGGPASVLVRMVSLEGPDASSFFVDLPQPVDVGMGALDLPIELLADRSGMLWAEVVFETNLPEQPTLRANLYASSVPPRDCDLRVDRDSIRFGLVVPGDPRRRSVEISNQGEEPCLIWGVGVEGDDASAFAIGESLPDVWFMSPREALTIPVRFESENAPTARMLHASLAFHAGSVAYGQAEVPITAFQAKSQIFHEPPSLDTIHFEATPVGQASMVPFAYVVRSKTLLAHLLSDGSSPAFRLPARQDAFWHSPICRNHGGMGAPCDDTVSVAFVPASEGVHRGQLELNLGYSEERYLIDLVGFGVPACTDCGWPSPSCPSSKTTTVLEEVPFVAPGGAAECHWSVGVLPRPGGGFRQLDRDFLMEVSTSDGSCDGTFISHVAGDYTLVNLEMRTDGRGAVCESTIHVNAPSGLWIEATAPRALVSPILTLFLLNGEGGDPLSKVSWQDPTFSCLGSSSTGAPWCPWDLPGEADDPIILNPTHGLPLVLGRIEEPSPLHSYSVGMTLYASYRPDAPDPIPSQIKVYCDGQLVSTMAPTFGYSMGEFLVVGTVDVPPSGGCTFAEDGVTRWANFWID